MADQPEKTPNSSDRDPTLSTPQAWRPVAGLENHPKTMPFSDRLFHWFKALGGLALMGTGLLVVVYSPIFKKLGFVGIGLGLAVFILSGPSDSEKKGYKF